MSEVFIDRDPKRNVDRFTTAAAITLVMSGHKMLCVETNQVLEMINDKLMLTSSALQEPFQINTTNYKFMWTVVVEWDKLKLQDFKRVKKNRGFTC